MKLSFVVPIYGVELYLRKCVDSLLHQDYDDYEIILVDDGSQDACPSICDEYASRYENIKVVHRNNGGLSAARNSGIKVARGEYICFVDSDDYWEKNVLGSLMAQIYNNRLDVLRFKWQNVREVGNKREDVGLYEVYNPYKYDPYKNDDYSEVVTNGFDFLNHRMGGACYAWAFILRNEIAQKELFTEGIYFEDTDWTPRMLLYAHRIASTEMIVYNYLIREGSITNAISVSKHKKTIEDKLYLIKNLSSWRDSLNDNSHENNWYNRMISVTVVSVLEIIATKLWQDRKMYLLQLQKLGVFPLCLLFESNSKDLKIKLINLSPNWAIKLIHILNIKRW